MTKQGLGSPSDRLFIFVFVLLTALCALPFWLTRLLPMQDYPHFLVFVRAFADHGDPSSPFHGTYSLGFPLSPLVLPIAVTRAVGALTGLETAGKVLWTLYAVGLPAASLHLLWVLRRDRWTVLLVFPLVLSYWVIGGFFAFATATPLFVLGLSLSVRWLEAPTWPRGVALAVVLCALHLWHGLVFAQLLLDFGALWLLRRDVGVRGFAPVLPSLVLFVAWMASVVVGRPPASRPPVWVPFFDNAGRFFEFIGPIVPGAAGATVVLALLVCAGAMAVPRWMPTGDTFRVKAPFGWLALLAVVSFLVLPSTCFGVEGIANRQPWFAALLLVFAWGLPARPAPRAVLLSLVGGAAGLGLLHLNTRFAAFGRESGGASRLLDKVAHGRTVLAPIGSGATASFPAKPLIALELYATARHGGLPNSSFAGYDINFIRYANGRNPMPGIGGAWLQRPELTRFDHVLLRGTVPAAVTSSKKVQLVARDGEWVLLSVCGSRALPSCG